MFYLLPFKQVLKSGLAMELLHIYVSMQHQYMYCKNAIL